MKKVKILLKTFVLTIFSLVSLHIIAFIIASITPKLDIKHVNSVFLYDKDKSLFFQGNGSKEWISLKQMSPYIVNATIASEDKNFYHHDGFDYLRIIKSLYENIKASKIVEGASTITQQYARNLYLDFDKNWKRKIEEAWLAFELEAHYSKKSILEGYLNTINYGNGVFGIENAAQYYFGKSAAYLSLAEASMLVGIPRSPNNYSPLNNEKKAKQRQLSILNSMVKNKYITEREKDNALKKQLVYIGKKDKINLSTLMYYQDAVFKELKQIGYMPEILDKNKGLKIYTALDLNAQTILENSINNDIKNNPTIQVSSIVVEPSTGNILALVGGRNYQQSQFNRATQSKRQVGSSIKPFLYYAALENGLTATSSFLSEPTVFAFSDNKTYAPNNFADIYPNKPITMAAAIAYSDNIYAVKTHLFLGEEALVDVLSRVGITQEVKPNPSLSLGTQEINIIDYLTGYATLANEGDKVELHLIDRVEDLNGKVLYKYVDTRETVLNKSMVYIINDLLAGTYDYTMVDYNTPTCIGIAAKMTNKYSVKSGTTNYDSWTIGYNKDVLVGVWNGYDRAQTLQSGDSRFSKNIWIDTIEGYLKDRKTTWYEMPSNVVGVLVNPITGQLANDKTPKKKILYFIKGTEPVYKK